MAGHGCHVDVCACGAVQAQCRCATPGKPRRVVRQSCMVCVRPVEDALGVRPKPQAMEFDVRVSPAHMTPDVAAEVARALMVMAKGQRPRMLSISFLVHAVRVTATAPSDAAAGWREGTQTMIELAVREAIQEGQSKEVAEAPEPSLGVNT